MQCPEMCSFKQIPITLHKNAPLPILVLSPDDFSSPPDFSLPARTWDTIFTLPAPITGLCPGNYNYSDPASGTSSEHKASLCDWGLRRALCRLHSTGWVVATEAARRKQSRRCGMDHKAGAQSLTAASPTEFLQSLGGGASQGWRVLS